MELLRLRRKSSARPHRFSALSCESCGPHTSLCVLVLSEKEPLVMNSTTSKNALTVATLCCGLLFAVSARAADNATIKLYGTKCAACHGADGSGNTVVGKALKIKDFK